MNRERRARGSVTTLSDAFVLALLLLLATRARADGAARGCAFAPSSSGTIVSSAWLRGRTGYLLVDVRTAVECLNRIKVNYEHAYTSVTSLANIFNTSHVFTAIAADPTDGMPKGLPIYDARLDLPAELAKLAGSWPKGRAVGLADLQFELMDIINRLRDAHVAAGGVGSSGQAGTLLGNALQNATCTNSDGDSRLYLVDASDGSTLRFLKPYRARGGGVAVQGTFMHPATQKYVRRTFRTINGKSPWAYFLGLADRPALAQTYKPRGTRINQLIRVFKDLHIHSMGRITALPDAAVTYQDGGAASRLRWAVTLPRELSAARLARLQADANAAGVPARALAKAEAGLGGGQDVNVAPSEAALPSAAVQPVEDRRRLQHTTSLLPGAVGLTYFNNSKDEAQGFWYLNATSGAMVLKVASFDFRATMDDWWGRFTSDAQAHNATSLLLDVTGNTGGFISCGLALVLGLYPMATYGDLGLRYDRILGEDAVYAYGSGLNPDALGATVRTRLDDDGFVAEVVDSLNGNSTRLSRLLASTASVLAAVDVLLASASKSQKQVCTSPATQDDGSCEDFYPGYANQLRAALDNLARSGGALTVQGYRTFALNALLPFLQLFWPYTGVRVFGGDPYASPRLIRRGGKWRNYTALFSVGGYSTFDNFRYFLPDLPENYTAPFRKILAVSDGYCGSTCDTFSRTAWFYSRRNPTAPAFKFLTFGGTGNPMDSAATAYPGGNINSDDVLTASWAYAYVGRVVASWLAWDELSAQIAAWCRLLPTFPAFLDNYTPQYTQAEVYNVASAGRTMLPLEYLRIPTDYYLPEWYTDTGLPAAGHGADLQALYSSAFGVLASMPGPAQA